MLVCRHVTWCNDVLGQSFLIGSDLIGVSDVSVFEMGFA